MGLAEALFNSGKEVKDEKVESRELHLLRALLHLLLYIGTPNDDSEIVEKAKKVMFTSGTNPPTNYGRPKSQMS